MPITNYDKALSEFKYHLIIKKIKIPRGADFENLTSKLYKCFLLEEELASDSIYVAQMKEVHDNDLVDLIIGFKRDRYAVKIIQSKCKFIYDEVESELEVAPAFKLYL